MAKSMPAREFLERVVLEHYEELIEECARMNRLDERHYKFARNIVISLIRTVREDVVLPDYAQTAVQNQVEALVQEQKANIISFFALAEPEIDFWKLTQIVLYVHSFAGWKPAVK